MKRLQLAFCASLLLVGSSATAQSHVNGQKDDPFIEVIGTAEEEVIPDEIFIGINLTEREAGKDKISIQAQETELKSALQRAGVPANNLTLADAVANYVKVSLARRDVVTRKQYMLMVNDAIAVGKVFSLLDSLKITDAYIDRVSHSEMEILEKNVRIKAIGAAKAKADYLLETIGQKTGAALRVHEVSNQGDPNTFHTNVGGELRGIYHALNEGSSASKEEDGVIYFEKIKLRSSVYARFAIE